jgi:hypothetical protein
MRPGRLTGQGGGQGGGQNIVVSGVYVAPDGVLRTVTRASDARDLAALRERTRRVSAPRDAARKSAERKISLPRLFQQVLELVAQNKPIPDEMRFLAGLQQLQHVLVYPEEHDLVIAGPADGWRVDDAGRVVGQSNPRPAFQLDDLVVALRAFPPDTPDGKAVGCSINHTPEGIQRLNEFLRSVGGTFRPNQTRELVAGVRNALGMQTIEVFGIPADTRLGLVLVEADYRMKLIGLGVERSGVRNIPSYVELLRPTTGSGSGTMQRWWFVPQYDAILTTDDALAWEFRGQRVKLLAADDFVKATGQVERGATADPTNKRFAANFTKFYPDLARLNPIFAELQNAVDLLVLASLIEMESLPQKVGWDLAPLLESEKYHVETLVAPKQVESAVNARIVGTRLHTPCGGVLTEPSSVMSTARRKADVPKQLEELRRTVRSSAKPDRWWWD